MNSIVSSMRRNLDRRGATSRHSYMELIASDPKDKMILLVGREDTQNGFRKFVVSRPHMESISRPWSEIVVRKHAAFRAFYGGRLCSKISVPDSDAGAMRIVLQIAHLQYHKLPQHVDFKELIQLAETSERYDLNTILRPFLKPWVEPYRSRLLEPGYEQWLYLAWQFGLEEEFLMLAHHLARHCAVNEAGQLLTPNTNRIIEDGIPREVLDTILKSRQRLLSELLVATYDLIFGMARSSSCVARDISSAERFTCTAKNTLGLQRYLKLRGLGSPLPSIDTIRMSPNEVIEILTHPSLRKSMTRPTVDSLTELENPFTDSPVERHEKCIVEDHLTARVGKIVAGQRWAVSLNMFNQLRHNAGQAPLDGTNTEYQNNRFIS